MDHSSSHKRAVLHENCERPGCPICEGGLFVCADCGAAEIEAVEQDCKDRQIAKLRADLGEAVGHIREMVEYGGIGARADARAFLSRQEGSNG